MPDIRLTRHARNRMRRLDWQESDVADLLKSPQVITPSVEGRENAWGQMRGRWYRITYIRESGGIVVITVTERRKGPEEGETDED